MAGTFLPYDHAEDDYIDMEVSSYSNFFRNSRSSPPHPREFEFHMSTVSLEKESSTSPADELFYKGKLLPLHLPPRLQMVEKLLQTSNSAFDSRNDAFEEHYSTPLMTTAPTPTATSTPFESCNISPSESCRVSGELNPEEYFSEYSAEVSGFVGENPKKSWTRKLNLVKQTSSLGSKLKASRALLKSLFGKSGCSADSCAAATKVADEVTVSKAKEYFLNKHVKPAKKTPFGQIPKEKYHQTSSNKQKTNEDGSGRLHRRSFSMVIKRNSTNKSSSSSSSSSGSSSSSCSSNSSNDFHSTPFLRRSNSTSSEMENPIQGAIAHCKQSQQLFRPSRKTLSEVGIYSLPASKISIREDQERPDLCRG